MEQNHQPNYGGMQFSAAAATSSSSSSSSFNNNNNNNNGLVIYDYELEGMTTEDYLNSFPPGFRFCPSDVELAEEYLKKKAFNEPLPPNKICEVNIYSTHPAVFAEKFQPIAEGEWYFFTPREKKYKNGKRPSRSTGEVGYWKPTGTDRPILSDSGKTVGVKKTLDYFEGKHPNGTKTDWKMHEYKLREGNDNPSRAIGSKDKDDMTLDECVLVRIYRKKEKNNGNNDEGRSGVNGENQPSVNEEGASSMLGNHNEAALLNGNHHQAALQNGSHNQVAFQNENHYHQPNPNQGLLLGDLSTNFPFLHKEIDREIESFYNN